MAGAAHERLNELYALHAPSAIRLAFLMTGDGDVAEDLVQEAFARLYARFGERKAPEGINAYLRRTIVNLSHDRHRKLKTLRAFIARGPQQSTELPADFSGRIDMRARLQRLPHRQRAALVLRYYVDMTEAQAADVIGCSLPALKQLVQRGLKTMRQQQQGEHHG
jgi:RNA polymerase sigma factor (sigma-70 family)